jgi:hypothetical protein
VKRGQLKRTVSGILFVLLLTSMLTATLNIQPVKVVKASPSGLVGWWKLDEGSGTTAYDSSGNGNNGTIYGATWTDGKFGKALKFDGVDDSVNVSKHLVTSSGFTAMAWFKLDSNQIVQRVLWQDQLIGITGKDVGDMDVAYFYESWHSLGTGVIPLVGLWYHVAETYDGTTLKVYVDGVLRDTVTTPIWDNPAANFLIGGQGLTGVGASLLNGTIDEVKVYARALSGSEVWAVYRGLVGYWKFDEGSGTIAHDSSGNSNDGTLMNGPNWVYGKFGKALSFDGVDDYVNVNDANSLDLTTVTIAAWVKTSSLEAMDIVSKGFDWTETPVNYGLVSANNRAYVIWTNGVCGTDALGLITDGAWHHVVGVLVNSTNTALIYVDGVLQSCHREGGGGATVNMVMNDIPLLIGRSGSPSYPYYFNGTIDEVKIYNRVLSSDEVQTLYWGVDFIQSNNIAVVPDTFGGVSTSTLPTSGFSDGYSPSFTSIGYAGVSYANLLQYDTVIMYQADPSQLTASEKTDLITWVSGGGKLIIWDSDAVPDTNYDWLPYPFTSHYPGQTGEFGGSLTILANNTLGSSDPASPYYIDTTNITQTSDAVGDAKVFLTHDSHWYGHMWATNVNGKSGFTHAYAYYQSGIIIYCGLDADFLGTDGWLPQNQWLFKTYELELKLQCPPPITPPGPIGITCYLTITATAGGTTNPPLGNYSYWENATATVMALPDTNYTLDHWELDGVSVGSTNPITVTMDSNHTLYAVFIGHHDVTVTSVSPSKTVVGQSYITSINVTAANQGDYTETFNITLYANSGQPINETGSVGTWNFDEGSGIIAHDISGNGNDGTLMNGPTWVDGKIGKALSFDGIDDYVEIPDSPELRLNESKGLTITLWFYRTSYPQYDNVLVSKQVYPGWAEYQLDLINTGDLEFKTWDSGYNAVIGSVSVPDANEWYHVAYVMNGTQWDFYVNGMLENSGTTSYDLYISNSNLTIGKDVGAAAFNGTIDEVKVYDRTLSAGEVWAEYTHPNTGSVGYWKFDEGTGTTAYDSSGNNNHGSLVNGPSWVDGKIGKALSFDQLGQYINVLDSNSLDIGTSDFTLAAWVYSEDRSGLPYGAGAILSKTLLGWPPPGYFFGILNNGSIYFELTRSPGGPENIVSGASNVPVPMNEWHYVAVTFQRNGNAIFYLDGNQVGSVDISSEMGDISNDRPLLIGESETYSNQFKGDIDEVKIYNRTLSANEIWAEYTRTGLGSRFALQTQTATLESGASTTLTFAWNTTGFAKGNYTLSAYAWPVQGETGTLDNTLTDGLVYVGVPGDVDGNHKVEIKDILMVAKAYGANPQSFNWNPNADVDCDGNVYIKDILITAKNYGKTDP